jgi:hypothetical protein
MYNVFGSHSLASRPVFLFPPHFAFYYVFSRMDAVTISKNTSCLSYQVHLCSCYGRSSKQTNPCRHFSFQARRFLVAFVKNLMQKRFMGSYCANIELEIWQNWLKPCLCSPADVLMQATSGNQPVSGSLKQKASYFHVTKHY